MSKFLNAEERNEPLAIITIAQMILPAIFQMMITGELWNPTDLFKVDMPETLKERQLTKAVKQAAKFLVKQGLTVSQVFLLGFALQKMALLQSFLLCSYFCSHPASFTLPTSFSRLLKTYDCSALPKLFRLGTMASADFSQFVVTMLCFEYVCSLTPARPPRVSVTTFTSYICCIYTLKFR